MNINIIDNNNNYNKYLGILLTNGFYYLINVYTRLPVNEVHSFIDQMFLKCNNNKIINNYKIINYKK